MFNLFCFLVKEMQFSCQVLFTRLTYFRDNPAAVSNLLFFVSFFSLLSLLTLQLLTVGIIV